MTFKPSPSAALFVNHPKGRKTAKTRLSGQIALAMATIAFSNFAAAASYKATLLDTLGGLASSANAINNAGQVVGAVQLNAVHGTHAMLWNGTTATDLGTLGGKDSWANAINNAGQIVGYAYLENGAKHATLWNGTTATDLGTLGGNGSVANAINNAGQVVGSASSEIYSHATLWNGTMATALSTNSSANAVNDAGHVVGRGPHFFDLGYPTATLWKGTTEYDLGTLGGPYSSANAINNAGQVVGWSSMDNGSYRATLWNGTTATDLGTLGGQDSWANAINNAGQIVGYAYLENGAKHATLWNGTTATDLNAYLDASVVAEGWVLVEAKGINDTGSIVANGFNPKTYESRGFLMTVTAVPEPQTYAMLLAGLGLVAGVARRRSKQQ
ncbi:PEP-CTERM sorting domain-containing protein [Roseateles albus]|uniref:PEP-CTERM sorting domain-containing protein n=1 Tax=Roseateles albus TaxID=2987525 RepID=A0ABT5KCD5_9BURK|nr:PEP-CTERM sorting domain-containing protein [Roseateles albus]MDC8770655.1 PEP-CTERM sorting domain-containing protein [Roseateles albus]